MKRLWFGLLLLLVSGGSGSQPAEEVTYSIDGVELSWKEAVLYSQALVEKGKRVRELLQRSRESGAVEDVEAVEVEAARVVDVVEVKEAWEVEEAKLAGEQAARIAEMEAGVAAAAAAEAAARLVLVEEVKAAVLAEIGR